MKKISKTTTKDGSSTSKPRKVVNHAKLKAARVKKRAAGGEARFRKIFDTVPVSIWVEDFSEVKKIIDELRVQGVNFRSYLKENPGFVGRAARMVKVIDINDMTLRLYGAKDKTELLGDLEKNLMPEALISFQDELIAIAEGESYFEGGMLDQTLQGKPLQLWRTIVFPKETAEYNSVLVCLTDITERKQVEDALRESEARLLTVLEATPIPLTLTSFKDGIVLYGNSAIADLLGVPISEIIGQRATNYYTDPADRVQLLAELERLGSLRDKEMCLRRRDGTDVWVSLSSERISLDGQACLLSAFYDISARKHAEALQSAIYQISEAATKSANLYEFIGSVHAIVGQVMPAQNFYLALYDAGKDLLSFPYYVDEVDGSASIPAGRPGRGMTEYVIRTGKPLLSDLSNFEELTRNGEVELVGPPSPIWIGAPLIVERRTIGAIALQDYHNPNVYSERELRMLEFVSGQVAKAIERTRLSGDIQRHNRILSALQEATLPLISQRELSEVLQAILAQAAQLLNSSNGYIYLVAPDEKEIHVVLGMGMFSGNIGFKLKPGEGLAGKVWQTAQSLNIQDYHTWAGRSAHFEYAEFQAVVGVPLISGTQVIGVLGLAHLELERTFSEDDLELLNRFAQLASIAFENARLYTLSGQELAERKIAEESLREAEAKYRSLVERLPVVVYTSELGATGTWHYVSPQIESLLSFTPEEWMADPTLWYEQVHPDDRDHQETLEEQAFERGESFDAEYRIRTRNGREVWVRDTAQILPSPEGEPPLVQGVLVDITDRKQGEFLQAAIYRIGDAANASESMDELYLEIHRSLQSIMLADNFFIAAYDKKSDLLSFPYYVDEYDGTPATALLGRGVTAYVIRNGSALLGRPDAIQNLEDRGEVESMGMRSIDWLGVPLKIQNETIGVMAVQTYTEGIRYSQRDLDILSFVSTQVALSIERKQAEENLRSAETQYRTLVEQLPIVVYTNPPDDIYSTVYVSPQIKIILGYTQEQWLEDPVFWSKALHPEDRPRVLEQVERINESGAPFDEEYRMITREGHVIWIRDQSTLIHDMQGRPLFWQGLMIDVSERKSAENKIKRQVERLKALRTIDMFIAGGTEIHLTLQTILNQSIAQLGIDAADILLLNPSMHTLDYAEGIGFRTRDIEQTSLRLGEGLAGRAALEREMVSIQDISSSRDAFIRRPALAGEEFISHYGVPLIAKGEVKGVLEIFNRTHIDADREWRDFLESLAGQAALALDNASLFDSLQRSNLELSLAYETTLEGWSAALDLRDKETEGHTQRVANLTLTLAEAMGLSEKERVHMRRGALLHDIGKMGIPDRILLKPDQLTEEEWDLMRQHPIYAYNMLSPVAHLRPALDIPYCHHEKWDGTGYPRGLKGEAIPLVARIFAVADVWDALCSDRPYRPAWTKEKALNHIIELSGRHFDPKVVDWFIQVIGQA